MTSTDAKTWLITGAGRGMGACFARAGLAAGHNVVASGRNLGTVTSTIGDHEQLLVTELDITDAQSAEQPVAAAVERFWRVDVLVNNAGNGVEQKARLLLAQVDVHRELSTSLAHDDARVAA